MKSTHFVAPTFPSLFLENDERQKARLVQEQEDVDIRHAFNCAKRWLSTSLSVYEHLKKSVLDTEELVTLLFDWCRLDGIKEEYHESIVEMVGEMYSARRNNGYYHEV